jgi:hypothetical protein
MPYLFVADKQPLQLNQQPGTTGLFLQNTGSKNIYIGTDQNMKADSTSVIIPPGTPLTWPSNEPLYVICASGDSSSLVYYFSAAQMGVSLNALITPTAQYVAAALANTLYVSKYTLINGIYTINATPSAAIIHLDFYDKNGNLITSQIISAGTVVINLATTSTQLDYWSDTPNVQISILKTGSNIPFAPSGALFTITANQTFAGIGDGYFLLVGGGQGGEDGGGAQYSGKGGMSGKVISGRYNFTGNTPITIGQGGLHYPFNAPTFGTETTMGTITTATGNNVGGGARIDAALQANGLPGNIILPTISFPFINTTQNGATSSGSGAASNNPPTSFTGGIGGNTNGSTGGNGGSTNPLTNGTDGTGHGSAGGGGAVSYAVGATPGGNGTNGVCYIII